MNMIPRRFPNLSAPHERFTQFGVVFCFGMIIAGLAGILTGCSTPSSEPPTSISYLQAFAQNEWLPADDHIDAKLAAGQRILAGFDDPHKGKGFLNNDQLLLAVELDHNGAHELWFIGIRVTDDDGSSDFVARNLGSAGSEVPPLPNEALPSEFRLHQSSSISFDDGTEINMDSSLRRVEVSVFDEYGELLKSSSILLPPDIFKRGPYESCSEVYSLYHQASLAFGEDLQSVMHHLSEKDRIDFGSAIGAGALSMLTFVQAVQENKALAELRSSAWLEIARVPSLLNIVSHLGLRLSVEPDFIRSRPALYRWPGLAQPLKAFEFPTIVRANEEVALRCRIVATRPRGVLQISAGMLYFEAVHPDKPENRVRIRILAARYGKALSGE